MDARSVVDVSVTSHSGIIILLWIMRSEGSSFQLAYPAKRHLMQQLELFVVLSTVFKLLKTVFLS